jgi:hypothetical protein
MPEEEWPLIEYEKKIDVYWYYTFMAPDGTVVAEGENPYETNDQPFTIRLYPYVNSEIHPFMGNIIDQQRYINRLIIMHDMAARAAAKGLTIFPIENIPDGMSKEDIAREGDSLLAQGGVLVSPGISPGEKDIMARALEAEVPVILICNNGFSDISKPGGRLFDACAAGKVLMISPFEHRNDYQRLTAECCHEMNALARAIATRR